MIGCAKFSAIPATVQSGSLLSAAWGLGPSPVHWGRAPARCTHEAACTHPVKVSKHPRRVRENIFMLNTAGHTAEHNLLPF